MIKRLFLLFLSTCFLNMSMAYAGPTGCDVTVDGFGMCKQDIADYNGITSSPAVSNLSQGRIYFDSSLNKFRCSENGGAFTNCVGGGSGSQTPWTSDINGAGFKLINTGNIGIGTTIPGQALDIVGTARMLGIQLPGGAQGQIIMQNALGIGTWSPAFISTGANPTATVSTSAVNGSSINFMRADAAPAIDQTMTPTWTGKHIFNNSTTSFTTGSGNVGIGSAAPGQLLDILGTTRFLGNFNVGIGSIVPGSSFDVIGTSRIFGNVGINTSIPGQLLDINGTARMLGIQLTGGGQGQVITQNAVGIGTWAPVFISSPANPTASVSTAAVNGSAITFMRADAAPAIDQTMTPTWTGKHIFNNATTSFTTGAGNVGLNSATPGQYLDIQGTVRFLGNFNIGIGSIIPGARLDVFGTTRLFGNVGIGTSMPGQLLDIQGTARMFGIQLTGGAQGQVIMQNGVGIGTWSTISASGGSSQWATQNTTDVSLAGGNVGIGTTFTTTAALNVMNGNVGIGTWAPRGKLDVEGTLSITTMGGNVGIGTWVPATNLDVEGTLSTVRFSGNVGISTIQASSTLAVGPYTGNTWMFRVDNNTGAPVSAVINSATGTDVDHQVVGAQSANNNAGAQVFTLTGTNVITSATIRLDANSGSPSGTMTCSINTTSAGVPTLILANANLTAAITPTASTTNIFTYTPGTLTAGTYALVCVQTIPGAGNNAWNVSLLATGNFYFSINGGSSWTGSAEQFYYQISGYSTSVVEAPFVIDGKGNVGVNQSTPINVLDVNGNGTIGGSYAGTNTAPSNGLLVQGNVGINTVSPGQQLDVQGTVRSSGGFSGGSNCFYYCNGGVDLAVLSRGSSCLCPGGSCVATNICSN